MSTPYLNTALEPVLSVAYHDDARRIGDILSLAEVAAGQPMTVGFCVADFGEEPLGRDSCIGRAQFELMPWQPAGRVAIKALHETVTTYVNEDVVTGTRILNNGDRICAGRMVLVLHHRPPQKDTELQQYSAISGLSDSVQQLRQHVFKIAPTNTSVVLIGEPGVGKEVIAHELHRLSGRRGRMASLNCRALPESLGKGYLVGWMPGAFDGATTERESLFESANTGTLFLDAIDEMSPDLQKALIEVLESGEFVRMGCTMRRQFDVRIVSATCVGTARLDPRLIQLIGEKQLNIPPLRERPEDIPLLSYHLLHRCARELSMKAPIIGFGLMKKLLAASWPLNARALRKALKSLLVVQPNQARLAPHPVLREALGAAMTSLTVTQEVTLPPRPTPARFITDAELREVAETSSYDAKEVARRLGCDTRSIIRRLSRLTDSNGSRNLNEQ